MFRENKLFKIGFWGEKLMKDLRTLGATSRLKNKANNLEFLGGPALDESTIIIHPSQLFIQGIDAEF